MPHTQCSAHGTRQGGGERRGRVNNHRTDTRLPKVPSNLRPKVHKRGQIGSATAHLSLRRETRTTEAGRAVINAGVCANHAAWQHRDAPHRCANKPTYPVTQLPSRNHCRVLRQRKVVNISSKYSGVLSMSLAAGPLLQVRSIS